MSFWQNLLRLMDTAMETPGLYGWFHILALVITVILAVWMSVWYRWSNRDGIRRMVLTVAIVVAALEIYKQINFSFGYADGITFDFQWYAFPFQFCSTPLYVGLLAGLTKKGKLHEAASAYLATYAVFAGICVMLYPSTVFIDTVGINIQTMICHGSMIVVGVCLIATGYVPLNGRTFWKAACVFISCVALAVVMNEIAFRSGLLETEEFNMFFISPYCDPSLPVYSLVQEIVPFPFCLMIYVAGFSLAAYLVMLAAMGIRKLSEKKRSKITA